MTRWKNFLLIATTLAAGCSTDGGAPGDAGLDALPADALPADARPADARPADTRPAVDAGRESDAPRPDASLSDAAQPLDIEAPPADGAPTPPADCDLIVALSMQPVVSTTKITIAAGSKPKLCWTIPAGATTLPGPDGWDLELVRDGVGSGGPDTAEWTIIRGVPPTQTSIVYGDCPPQPMLCLPAKALTAGGHSLAIWDGTRVGGLAGMIKFSVN